MRFCLFGSPYVCNGHRLYYNSYARRPCQLIPIYVKAKSVAMDNDTDNADIIQDLYLDCKLVLMPIQYSPE